MNQDKKLPRAVPALLVLGLLLRLWATGHARFTGDESHQYSVAEAITRLAAFPAYGLEVTSSAARHPGPLAYFLVALPQLLGDSPRLGGAFVAILHVLCGWLLAMAALRVAGARTALISTMLFAFAPWDILYGDRIWGSSLSPTLGALALYGVLDRRPAWQATGVAAALCLPQLHLSAPVVWVAMVTLAVLDRTRPPWSLKALSVGFALAAVAYSPAIVAELRSGFSNSHAILSHAAGTATPEARRLVPLQTFGYAILYSSGEIGYHFARGYWGGGFREVDAYFTRDGIEELVRTHGGTFVVTSFATVGVAILGWAAGIAETLRRSPAAKLTLSLVAGLVAAAALMFVAKKGFFPHYANVLMPLLLIPTAVGLSRLGTTGVALAISSAAAMGVSTVRYYLEIDRLNGVTLSEALVERISKEPGPVSLAFTHFDNRYALDRLAEVVTGAPLRLSSGSIVRYRVHNSRPHTGSVAEGSFVVDGVLVERTEQLGRVPPPPGLLLRASNQLEELVVVVDGIAHSAQPGRISYGQEPWQHLAREIMRFDGKDEELLFFHPIAGSVVTAIANAHGARRVVLTIGLSDDAVRASAEEVRVRLLGPGPTQQVVLGARRGLMRIEAALPAGTATVGVELTVQNDGARVIGFDLELAR
ncbi:MAG: hypothetical protein HYV07_02815 [Deltaproteobacteria bacterium]|nr:hypothetical protein [Deltaproteobacteria bacterium]